MATELITEYPKKLMQYKPQTWAVTNTEPTADVVPPENCIFILGDLWRDYIVDQNGNITAHNDYICVYDEPGKLKWDNSGGTPFNY